MNYDYMLDPPDYDEEDVCADCGESFDYCDCYCDDEPEIWDDERADMVADKYFGDL